MFCNIIDEQNIYIYCAIDVLQLTGQTLEEGIKNAMVGDSEDGFIGLGNIFNIKPCLLHTHCSIVEKNSSNKSVFLYPLSSSPPMMAMMNLIFFGNRFFFYNKYIKHEDITNT